MPASVHCQVCGRLPTDGSETISIGISVPTMDYRNKPLDVPGVHFACRTCRQAIAHAEREQKLARRAAGELEKRRKGAP